jgi:dicarboxylate transporter 10
MVREEGVSSLARGVTPNVFRAILMNASQLASWVSFSIDHSFFRLRASGNY